MVEIEDLGKTLAWLAGTGLSVWGVMVSDFFRNLNVPAWKGMKPVWKQVVVLAATIVPPVAAYVVLLTVPPETIAAIQPHYRFITSLFIAVLAGRGIFEITKEIKFPSLSNNNLPRFPKEGR